MTAIRYPSVAGLFYPADPKELAEQVRDYLTAAQTPDPAQPAPKAIIAPHAGYIYSGPVAGSAYAQLAGLAGRIARVVLLGPAHRVALRGLAYSRAESFLTPLGAVPVDRPALAGLADLPQVREIEAPFEGEHCLEVQLPFLQLTLGAFRLVPLLVGDAEGAEVAEVLERLWGGEETLIVISSDLSHYMDYASATSMDAQTSKAIEDLRPEAIGYHQACGRIPVAGLLQEARSRGLHARTLDLRNSGDTAGPKDRVVGYGAYAVG
jgi:AmmeMemoRadiSam system protein B